MKRPKLGNISANVPVETATSNLHYMKSLEGVEPEGHRPSTESHTKENSDSGDTNNASSSDHEFLDEARKWDRSSITLVPKSSEIPILDGIFDLLESLLIELHSPKKVHPSHLCSLPCTFIALIRPS
jgi:hypothetical protein